MWKSIAAAVAVLAIGLGAGAYYAHLHPFTGGQGAAPVSPSAADPSANPGECPAARKSCPACQVLDLDEPACPACQQAAEPAAPGAVPK
jgi:hypothetical protein